MTRKPSDMSGIIAKKGEATSATTYPGDQPKTAGTPRKATGSKPKTAPERYKYEAPERRSDSLTMRLAPSERKRLQALAERTGAPLTQVIVWGIEALEREMGDG